MKKNIVKSMIQSIVRAIWKVVFKPIVKQLPESKVKKNLIRAGGKIEKRQWWGYKKQLLLELNAQLNAQHTLVINDYLLNELQSLSEIEREMTPNEWFIQTLQNRSATPPTHLQPYTVASAYGVILRYLKKLDFDVVFLAPWLKRGGADLGLLHHIQAQYEKSYRILLITTEDTDSPWLYKLPENAVFLNLSEFTKGLSEDNRKVLLARLLLQTQAQTIHNINSRLGWDVFQDYGKQLVIMHKKLFVSVFCEDEIKPNVYWGYAPVYLPNTHHLLSNVFCDTKWYPNDLINRLKLQSSLFKTIYFPFLNHLSDIYHAKPNQPILWASRLAKQKRPELLYQIASGMPNQQFHIYGECEKACEAILEKLQTLPNVKYMGVYNHFSELLTSQHYSAFLYTSKYDGLPNVLIEAIASGLPVISFDVGGIGELIHEDVLLNDGLSLEENLHKIQNLILSPEVLQTTWQYSYEILNTRHSWQSFVSSLEQVPDYFPALSQEAFVQLNQNMRILSRPNM